MGISRVRVNEESLDDEFDCNINRGTKRIEGTLDGIREAGLFCKRTNSLLIRKIDLLEQWPTPKFAWNVWNASCGIVSSCFHTLCSEIVLTSLN